MLSLTTDHGILINNDTPSSSIRMAKTNKNVALPSKNVDSKQTHTLLLRCKWEQNFEVNLIMPPKFKNVHIL